MTIPTRPQCDTCHKPLSIAQAGGEEARRRHLRALPGLHPVPALN